MTFVPALSALPPKLSRDPASELEDIVVDSWELLLIDNLSSEPLSKTWDLSGLPNARHVWEETLGLTPARLRGIDEARGDVLVFVDDDNVLTPGFLEEVDRIGREWPLLGAWGGSLIGEYEGGPPPEKWKRGVFEHKITRDAWSNNYDRSTTPTGAGICVRRHIAQRYSEVTRQDPLRIGLGRKGAGLNVGEDIDMAYVACDIGLGTGVFTTLELGHLIPARRMENQYLYRLREGFGHANTLVMALRGQVPPDRPVTDRVLNFRGRLRHPLGEWKWHVAWDSGRLRAIREFREARRHASG